MAFMAQFQDLILIIDIGCRRLFMLDNTTVIIDAILNV